MKNNNNLFDDLYNLAPNVERIFNPSEDELKVLRLKFYEILPLIQSKLSIRQSSVIVCYYGYDMLQSEIAKELDMYQSNVSTTLAKARSILLSDFVLFFSACIGGLRYGSKKEKILPDNMGV